MKKTVLVIDDSKTTRSFARQTLEVAGYAVLEAEDGQLALDALRQAKGPVDMAFCDVNMPHVDGLTFLEQLKATPHQGLPVVMLTTESGGELVARGKAAGARGWMVKPFRPEKLLDLAHRFAPLG